MSGPMQLQEKITAFKRATELFLGMKVETLPFQTHAPEAMFGSMGGYN
jgi:hypothetical protein